MSKLYTPEVTIPLYITFSLNKWYQCTSPLIKPLQTSNTLCWKLQPVSPKRLLASTGIPSGWTASPLSYRNSRPHFIPANPPHFLIQCSSIIQPSLSLSLSHFLHSSFPTILLSPCQSTTLAFHHVSTSVLYHGNKRNRERIMHLHLLLCDTLLVKGKLAD